MESLSIGQLAKRVKVNVQTIRYYQRRGLMPEPRRRQSGYRQYSWQDLERLQFIRRAKELGFSLKEILELLSLQADRDSSCTDVKKRTEAKIADVEQRILALEKIKQALTQLASLCMGRGPISECPILEAISFRSL